MCSHFFSHGEGSTGFYNHLGRSNTASNTYKHVVQQPYILCLTVQRLFGVVMIY